MTGDLTGDLTGDVTGDVALVDEYTALPFEEKEQIPMSDVIVVEAPVQSSISYLMIWNLDPGTNNIKYLCHINLGLYC